MRRELTQVVALFQAELSILDSPSAAYGSSYEAFNASEPLVFLAEGKFHSVCCSDLV